MIGHIFLKDCRLLYPLALIVAALHLLDAVISATVGAFMEPRELGVLATFLSYLSMLGVMALTAAVVHQDPLTSTSEDFLVRPIRRRDLLLAKLLFVVLIVLAPVVVAGVLEGALSGFDVGTSLGAAFADALSKFLLLALPAMALASVSRNFIELVAGSLLLFVLSVGLMMLLSNARGKSPPLSGSGLEWIRPASIALLFLVIGAVVLPAQYVRRTTFRSWGMIAFAGLLAAALWLFIPWAPSFAVQQALGAHDARASRITLTYAPEIGRFRQTDGSLALAARAAPANLVPLFVPLRFEGVAPDEVLLMDRAVFRIRRGDGKTLFESTDDPFGRNYARRVREWRPAGTPAAAQRPLLTFEELTLPVALFARLKAVDTAVEIDYSFSVMRPQPEQILPALGADDTAQGRRCLTRADVGGDAVEVACLSANKAPSCTSVFLRHDVSGARNPPRDQCWADYTPYPLTLALRTVKRFGASIPFNDAALASPYPVSARLLKESHVVIVAYEAVAHVSGHVRIPAVRVADWQPQP
jgi:ABC-type transport system involved in multi-copper enzyme maturation permease subunit